MEHKRPSPRIIIPIVIVLLIGGYYGWRMFSNGSNGALTASGSIEATDVNISPDMAGKVAQVLVDEGQTVKAGDVLFSQEDTLLQAQKQAAVAGLATAKSAAEAAQAAYTAAQTQYEIALNSARAADRDSRISDWVGKRPDYFDQPSWYFTREEQISALQVEVQKAADDLLTAQNNLNEAIANVDNAKFLAAEERLSNARVAYLVAKEADARAQVSEQTVHPEDVNIKCPPQVPSCYRFKIRVAKLLSGDDNGLLDVAQNQYDAAKQELEDAQDAYDDTLSTQAADDVMNARAEVTFATERLAIARDHLNALRIGEDSLAVTAAADALDQAKAGAGQASDAVDQAQAQLNLIETQINKLTVYSPMDGVVLTRNIEPGEFVQPGSTAFVLGRLDNLTITVYVPEDRYGEINLGQSATMTVDSFPGEQFEATVYYISDQAEFTPRNVQTVEGRSSTVYAIKLKVTDPQGKLKPGMPADVIFSH